MLTPYFGNFRGTEEVGAIFLSAIRLVYPLVSLPLLSVRAGWEGLVCRPEGMRAETSKVLECSDD